MEKGEVRDSYVRVRLTKQESDELNRLSKEQRRTKSEIIRMALDLLIGSNNNEV